MKHRLAPQPIICDHPPEVLSLAVCKCICIGCWNSRLPIGERCIDGKCQVHHRSAKVVDKRALTK